MRVSLTPAFVIHRRTFSETSLILELFTRDYGRVGALAKGARRPRSRWSGTLEPFQCLEVSWSGRGELPTLTAAEIGGPRTPLLGGTVVSGLYLNELLIRLTARHDPHPELYAHYAGTIATLSKVNAEQLALRLFEKNLLDSIGYGLLTHTDADTGESIDARKPYRYVLEHGPSRQSIKGCPVDGSVLLGLESGDLNTADQFKQAKRLMRFALAPHLGERPLYSRALYEPPASSR